MTHRWNNGFGGISKAEDAHENESQMPDVRVAEEVSLKQVSAFLAVVELHNITNAAEQLHMSQSGLSRVISHLEVIVGERLFVRSASGLALSATGAAFLPYAQRLQSSYIDMLSASRGVLPRGQSITIACTDVALPLVVSGIKALQQRGAGSTPWRTIGMNSLQVVRNVSSGEAAAGICMNTREAEELCVTPLLSAPLGLLCAVEMQLPPVINTLASLERVPIARLSDDQMLPCWLRDHQVQFNAYFDADVIAKSTNTLIGIVREGKVATIVSAIAASLPLTLGLRFMPFPELLPAVQLNLVSRRGNPSQPKHKNFLVELACCVQQAAWSPWVNRIPIVEN